MDDAYCLFVISASLIDLALPPVAYVVFAVMAAPIVWLTGVQRAALIGGPRPSASLSAHPPRTA